MIPNQLYVYYESSLMGTLTCSPEDEYGFSYDAGWLRKEGGFPLSQSLPLSEIPYSGYKVRSFFGNLLPEETIRAILTRRLGISESNDYALLSLIGRECAGALSLVPELQSSSEKSKECDYESLDDDRLTSIIKQLPEAPLLADEDGVSMSLAGAQNKLPLFHQGNNLLLPKKGAPSNCIIKIPIPNIELFVENEYFFMQLAHQSGLSCAQTQYRKVKDIPLLLVERYDRIIDKSGATIRLHQEDFCQALGISHERKYEMDGGPSLRDGATLIRAQSSLPMIDLKGFLRWIVFNVCIGNMDAHAKNISFLYVNGTTRLAPFYDLLSTLFYGKRFKKKLAMRVGGQDSPRYILKHHWEQFAADIGVPAKTVLSEINLFAEQINHTAQTMILPELSDETLGTFRNFVSSHCRQVLKSASLN